MSIDAYHLNGKTLCIILWGQARLSVHIRTNGNVFKREHVRIHGYPNRERVGRGSDRIVKSRWAGQ